MKSMQELEIEERLADQKYCRSNMRSAAMCFRQAVSPKNYRRLSERVTDGAEHLARAITYRGHAASYARMVKTIKARVGF